MLAPGIDLYVSEVLGPSSVASTKDAIRDISLKARTAQLPLGCPKAADGQGLPQWLQSARTRRGYRLIAEIEGFEHGKRRTRRFMFRDIGVRSRRIWADRTMAAARPETSWLWSIHDEDGTA